MKIKNNAIKSFWRYLLALSFTLFAAGCHTVNCAEDLSAAKELQEERVEPSSLSDLSNLLPENCMVCGKGEGTALPLYRGQKNLGIINLNTFDLAPVTINQYDDYGNLIEESVKGSSTHITNTRQDGFMLSVTADINRGYADGHLSFHQEEALDIEKAATYLCTNCINEVLDQCWTDRPFCMGVIDFDSGKIRLFEEKITAFVFDDYYISCNRQDMSHNDRENIDLLIFYCPERY